MARSIEEKRARRLARHDAKVQREQDKAAMYAQRRVDSREAASIDMGFVGLLATLAAKKAARDNDRAQWREFGRPETSEPMDQVAVTEMHRRAEAKKVDDDS